MIFRKLGLVDNYGPTGLGFIAAIAAIFGSLFGIAIWLDSVSCSQYGDSTGRGIEYRFPAGCFVERGAHFIPVDEYKARAVTNEAHP